MLSLRTETPAGRSRGKRARMGGGSRGTPDITKAREVNGYGVRTSMYSITQIGRNDASTSAKSGRPKAPAATAAVFGMLHNASRKNVHMQIHYPQTIGKLQPPRGDVSRKELPHNLIAFGHPDMYKTRFTSSDIPFSQEYPAKAKTMISNTQLAKTQREGNKGRSTRCQWSF